MALLAVTGACLAAGGGLHLAAAPSAGDAAWIGGALVGAAYSLWTMAAGLRQGRVGVDVIAVLALLGAVAVGEDLAAAVISVMVASGRALEGWADRRARRDLRALLARAPQIAHRYRGTTLEVIPVADLAVGDVALVAPGEVVPTDGILSTDATLDESALSGESLPVERRSGDPVRSGVVNAGNALDLRVTTPASESTYAAIVRLVDQAESSQAPVVRLADRWALGFLGVTLVVAAGAWVAGGPARAVAVLVVATPCPLILAVPVALVSGLSLAARRGVVIKGGGVLERLARCTTVLVDKTGTLTTGRPALSSIVTAGTVPADELLGLAASLDQVSPHVLAGAIVRAAQERGCPLVLPHAVEEVAGQGIRGLVGDRPVALGKAAWVGVTGAPAWTRAARRRARLDGSLTVFVAADDHPVGVLVMDDPLRPDAAHTLRALRQDGVRRIVLATGDRQEVAESIGAVLGVDQILAEQTPADKLEAVRAECRRAPTVMVGDGINDAPALALADVGVAMGARGATASSEAADVVLTVDRLERLGEAKTIARRSRRIATESMSVGVGLSLAAMGVAAAGSLPAVWGAILQEGIDVAVILNALRALRSPPGQVRLPARDAELARRFQTEHLSLRRDLDQLRAAADALDRRDPAAAIDEARRVRQLLERDIGPHEKAEQETLYPALDRALGGADPTGPMSRAHAEIARQIRRLGQLLDDIGPSGPDAEDVVELRRLLYGLHAVLALHNAQEDESYLSLDDEPPVGARPAASTGTSRAGEVGSPPGPQPARSGAATSTGGRS